MGSKAPGGVIGVAVIGFALGCYLIYSGGITAISGLELASTGGEFEDILATLGGFWQVLGLVLILMGILCFIVGAGLLTMKEWGRKNGFLVHIIIASLSLIMGMIVGFFDIPAALPFFAVVAVSGICAIHLWRPVTKYAFEFQGGRTKPRGETVEVYSPKVIVRHKAVRTAAPRIPSNMRKCQNCETVNPVKQDFCRICGTELEKN